MIKRSLEALIRKRLSDNKVIIVLGPRQSGKTTLIKDLANQLERQILWWNGDESDIRLSLKEPTSTLLQSMIGKSDMLIIDEAQRIENIGLCIKLIVDNIPDVKVIATGSSAFELANRINEPLTGRKWEYYLFPLSYQEMAYHHGEQNEKRLLERRLVYGYYPDVINHPGEEKSILKQLADSYLYKDILTWEKIQKPERMETLLRALAFQLGNQVSYNELGNLTGLDKETVERYIILLERAFIIFRLGSLSRNLRNELKKSRKIYFYDNGIRNAIINQFNTISLRNDTGQLWENFLISERLKYLHYKQIHSNRFFWRTHSQQEVDYIEEKDGLMDAYEFKWGTSKRTRFPKSFLENYKTGQVMIITKENFMYFITQSER